MAIRIKDDILLIHCKSGEDFPVYLRPKYDHFLWVQPFDIPYWKKNQFLIQIKPQIKFTWIWCEMNCQWTEMTYSVCFASFFYIMSRYNYCCRRHGRYFHKMFPYSWNSSSKSTFEHFQSFFMTYFSLKSGSTPTVGSSNINSFGSWKNAHIMLTRRFWPPLKKQYYSGDVAKYICVNENSKYLKLFTKFFENSFISKNSSKNCLRFSRALLSMSCKNPK